MKINLKYNGLAWYVENDSSDITNEMYVYNTDGSLSHVVSDSYYTDYDGDGTAVFEETTSGCTFYKYTGAISEQICATPLENNVFKLIEAQQFSEPTIFNGDKSKLALDTAIRQSKTISEMYENFQDGVDEIYNAIVAQGVTPSSSTPEDCATGISTVATNKYNAGKNSAYIKAMIGTAGGTTTAGGYTYLSINTNNPGATIGAITKVGTGLLYDATITSVSNGIVNVRINSDAGYPYSIQATTYKIDYN